MDSCAFSFGSRIQEFDGWRASCRVCMPGGIGPSHKAGFQCNFRLEKILKKQEERLNHGRRNRENERRENDW
jgi:hypothetical protein